MNKELISYQGKVNLKYTVDGKEINFKTHNEGLNGLFKYICKTLAGDFTNLASEKPAFIDAICVYYDIEEPTVAKSESCLYNPLTISNPNYTFDTDYKTWVAKFQGALSYSMIDFSVLERHPKGIINLYLLAQNKTKLARLSLEKSSIQLDQILPGTQALIE